MASQKQKLPKGLPKRARNEVAKARRKRSWEKNQRAKALRIKAQKEAEKRNAEFRAQGLPTPYEARQAERRARHLANRH